MKKLVALVMTALCLLAVGCSKQEDDQIIDVVVPSTPEAVVTPVPTPEQPEETPEVFRGFAQDLGLDMGAYDAAIADPATAERVQSDTADGEKLGVNSTPTFFIDGEKIVLQEWDDLEQAIEKAVNG